MDRLLDSFQASEMTRLARSTLAKKRLDGSGPPFARLGTKIVYRESDLIAWLEEQPRLVSTSGASA